jgi:hypothetical protein
MKLFLSIILTGLLCFIAGLFLPWWSIALIAFLVGLLLPQPLWAHFISGFSGVFLLWMILAIWIDQKNEHILSSKMAQVFHLGTASFLLIIVTALIGGLVGGFAAMSGGSLHKRRPAGTY